MIGKELKLNKDNHEENTKDLDPGTDWIGSQCTREQLERDGVYLCMCIII